MVVVKMKSVIIMKSGVVTVTEDAVGLCLGVLG